jgi:hypothetical protein
MKKSTEQTIFEMLTENTGRALCDSGDAYGRNWQSNQVKTLDDFRAAPSATLEVYISEKYVDLTPTVSVFHACVNALELDSYCQEYNAQGTGNFNGDYYGTDNDNCEWLTENGFSPVGEGFNTYNWNSNHSQVMQGQELERDGEKYVLLQIHGGCDVRGGYTAAKLFKLSGYGDIMSLLCDDCGFSVSVGDDEYLSLDWHGEWSDADGSTPDDDYLRRFAEAAGNKAVIAGDFYAYN